MLIFCDVLIYFFAERLNSFTYYIILLLLQLAVVSIAASLDVNCPAAMLTSINMLYFIK